jgi:hypothetical protein
MSPSFPPPTQGDHNRFLISFLFNGSMDPGIKGCVYRGYLDLSLTVHHINEVPNAPLLRASAHELMRTIVRKAICPSRSWTIENFDKWHEISCRRIQGHYAEASYRTFTVGQAQKWLNMSLKYALTLSALEMLEVKFPDVLRHVAHVPLDNYILNALSAMTKHLDLTPPGVESIVMCRISNIRFG